ncbi:MAG: copper-binding protein [Aquabacterium sp.]|nr:copper-binding protein [Aquabacterium sp.]
MKSLKALLILTAMLAGAAYAQSTMNSGGGAMAMGDAKKEASTSSGDMTDGEVRKVDKDTKKITIKHGEIKNLDMPGMTMVFQVKDPAMLDKVKAGDKVRFKAEKASGAIVVTDIQVAK